MARQSALHHWAEQAGAVFTSHNGWQTPAKFADARREAAQVRQGAGLADVSWMAKFDLKGLGVDSLAALPGGARSWPLGPGHLLVTCAPELREEVRTQCAGAARVWTTDVTSVFAQFLLAGPRAREILAKLSSLNVSERARPDGSCGQTSLAHVHATVLRQDLPNLPAFHVLVARDHGESVWEALLDAGHEFHLAPFGLEALDELGGV
jgi:heterotetrameric sarcosine oxidase gamma subunit